MVPNPVALGLTLCELVIVDQESKKPSAINIFSALPVSDFPSEPQHFSVLASLTGGAGSGIMELVGVRLGNGDRIYSQSTPIAFTDRLRVVRVHVQVRGISFPAAGPYEFFLFVDGHPVAQRRIRVYQETVS